MRTNPPRARSIIRTIQSTAHPADPVILPLIHLTVRAAVDPSSSLVGRLSPTFHPIIHSTDDPTSQPHGRPRPFLTHPVMPIILSLIHPDICTFDDPFSLSVGRPSPTFHPIVRQTDYPTILPFIRPIIHPIDDPFILSDPAIRPIIHPTDDLFVQSVERPSPINSDPSVHPTIFHGSHPNLPPDLTLKSSESSNKGYSTAMSEWPALLEPEKETFLFHIFEA